MEFVQPDSLYLEIHHRIDLSNFLIDHNSILYTNLEIRKQLINIDTAYFKKVFILSYLFMRIYTYELLWIAYLAVDLFQFQYRIWFEDLSKIDQRVQKRVIALKLYSHLLNVSL